MLAQLVLNPQGLELVLSRKPRLCIALVRILRRDSTSIAFSNTIATRRELGKLFVTVTVGVESPICFHFVAFALSPIIFVDGDALDFDLSDERVGSVSTHLLQVLLYAAIVVFFMPVGVLVK